MFALECRNDVLRVQCLLRIVIEYLGMGSRRKAIQILKKIEFKNETTFENFIGPSKLVIGYTIIWMFVKESPTIEEALLGISMICSHIDDFENASRAIQLVKNNK